jgi:deoxyribodipyrimidine photo-lyase
MGTADIQIVWFKRDLRVRDHAPLSSAAQRGPVLPLYIVEPELWQRPDSAAQHYDIIARSLVELRSALAKLGAPLIVRTGDPVSVLNTLNFELAGRIGHLWAYEETGNDFTFQRDRSVIRWARSNGVTMTEIPHDFIVRRLNDRDDWSSIARERMAQPLAATPTQLVSALASTDVTTLGHIPTLGDLGLCADAPTGTHEAGETAARATLKSFLSDRCVGYEKRLSSPITSWDGCSRLSTHLTYGTISLREVIARTRREAVENSAKRFSLRAFEERLHWRSHFIQKLEDEPPLEHRSYIAAFDGIRLDPETDNLAAERYEAWVTGHTGFPMVDACMRSLNATGWINFRMRAMLVSFASYDLWLDWRATSLHLARAFVDYEPGIHYPQVQMQSGTTGINTIRIYDPVKQGLDHDPTGDFVRRWVPELGHVDGPIVHQPWALDGTFWGVPTGYPPPIVNHADSVASAWAHIDRIKGTARRTGQSAVVLEQHGSRRPPPALRRGRVGKAGETGKSR